MNLQYISDSNGNITGVFIPIKDWEEREVSQIPEWQKILVR